MWQPRGPQGDIILLRSRLVLWRGALVEGNFFSGERLDHPPRFLSSCCPSRVAASRMVHVSPRCELPEMAVPRS